MSSGSLDFLMQPPSDSRDPMGWATVTQSSPLRIRLDGEPNALNITPIDLSGGTRYGPLSVGGNQVYNGDRVFVMWLSDSTRRSSASRIMILGPNAADPVGTVKEFSGAVADIPTGWVEAGPDPVSRTTYNRLFGVVGTFWGAGDGSTTFNVENRRDRVAVGAGGTFARGVTGGEITHALTADENGQHTHLARTDTGGVAVGWANPDSSSLRAGANSYTMDSGYMTSSGLGSPHNNMPPYVATTFIIKA